MCRKRSEFGYNKEKGGQHPNLNKSSCNDNWEEGDHLSFIHGVQTHDPVTGVPRAKMNGCKVVLSLTDDTPLMVVVNAIGFCSVGGFLGMSQPSPQAQRPGFTAATRRATSPSVLRRPFF